MKRFILLFFTFLYIFPTQVQAKNIKFIQVTDVHLTQNNLQNLPNFVDEINSKYQDLDFIIFTGDNIDSANIENLETFLKIIKNLKFKTYVIPGNHDVFKSQNLDKELYMKTVKKTLGAYHSTKTNYVFQNGEIVFLTMDGVKEVMPGTNGYYKEQELKWFDKKLTKYKNKRVVIFQHFPLLDGKSKRHSLYNKENYLDVLKNHNNVISIISGHYHENIEEKQGNIYHIVTMKFDSNHYYKLIEIDDETGMIFTKLINNSDENNNLLE